jgi:hypothetical protein
MEQIEANEFVKRQTPESKFSHFNGTWEDLAALTWLYINDAKPGYRQGVMLVPVPAHMFMTSIVKVGPQTPLEATFVSRQEGEEKHLGTISRNGKKQQAKYVEIVVYGLSVLQEEKPSESGAPWQIISINASPTESEVPFPPISRARNILGLKGGTDAQLEEKTKLELVEMIVDMARATIFWSQHVMIEPPQEENQ